MTSVDQLLPVFSSGDAIGGAVRRTRAMLQNLGFTSQIFADVIDHRLASETAPAADLAARRDGNGVVFYHLSVGSPMADLFRSLGALRVVVYHNITPPKYFEDTNPMVRGTLELGREQLSALAADVALCIADSEYNAAEARQAGYARVIVIPPPIDLHRLRPRPGTPVTPPVILFVGRFAVNKRHDTLIRALAVLIADGAAVRLALVGAANDNGPYVTALKALAERLGVSDHVEFHDQHVSDDELRRLYQRAAVFATASEHEGFCVPLVEAMAFDLPIVARDAAAIPGTLAGAGLLLDDDDPLLWAAALRRTLEDSALRDGLIAAGRHRFASFEPAVIQERLGAALRDIGVSP